MQLLAIRDLTVSFPTRYGVIDAAKSISLDVAPGEIVGLVGESGAGKSTIGNAIVNLLEPPGRVSGGEVFFKGKDLRKLAPDEIKRMRGRDIGMIFQDPQTSLNPVLTIGEQLEESIQHSLGVGKKEAQVKAIELLEAVGISHAKERLKSYPHQFSGGMRQRVVIALALCGNPDLVIADEPTTALDVSIQAQILELLRKLCQERQMGVILVTHDIGVIAEIADRVVVMYRGNVVETGETEQILQRPHHEYTKSLIGAVPPSDKRLERFPLIGYQKSGTRAWRKIDVKQHWLGETSAESVDSSVPVVEVENLRLSFVLKKAIFKRNRKMVHAIDDVSFHINKAESFGLVGESGSGKSTIARVIAGLYKQQSGTVRLFGKEVKGDWRNPQERELRRDVQMIFQDPYSSLNARMRVLDIVAEPIRFYGMSNSQSHTKQLVEDLLEHVELGADAARRYPHEFSGGQRQRISIARALASRPKLLICDEPTSALDVSIQAQILNLLKDLQEELDLTLLVISHDLPVIRQICDRVGVLQQGQICEIAPTEDLFHMPQHSYSQHLLALMPRFSKEQ